MARLYSLIQTEDRVYEVLELEEPCAWILSPDRGVPDILPVSVLSDLRCKLLPDRSERYLFRLDSYGGGIVYWAESYKDVKGFITGGLLRKIVWEEKD